MVRFPGTPSAGICGFRAAHWSDALMVALAGIGNGIAQLWWTHSLSLAPPSAVRHSITCRWYGQ
jgi:hypothetical protein